MALINDVQIPDIWCSKSITNEEGVITVFLPKLLKIRAYKRHKRLAVHAFVLVVKHIVPDADRHILDAVTRAHIQGGVPEIVIAIRICRIRVVGIAEACVDAQLLKFERKLYKINRAE